MWRKTKNQSQSRSQSWRRRGQSWGRRQDKLPPIPWMTEILTSSSCQALQEFGQMYSQGKPQKDLKHLPPLSRTYPQNLGLLPNYGGYVPGYKFQFGRTYGHLTQDALGLSTIQKQLVA